MVVDLRDSNIHPHFQYNDGLSLAASGGHLEVVKAFMACFRHKRGKAFISVLSEVVMCASGAGKVNILHYIFSGHRFCLSGKVRNELYATAVSQSLIMKWFDAIGYLLRMKWPATIGRKKWPQLRIRRAPPPCVEPHLFTIVAFVHGDVEVARHLLLLGVKPTPVSFRVALANRWEGLAQLIMKHLPFSFAPAPGV